MFSCVDVVEYNLNDNYRRYGFLSTVASKSTTESSYTDTSIVDTTTITSTDITSTTIVAELIQTDALEVGQIAGFDLTGPIDFNNQPTSNLSVTNLSASSGSITNMTTVESDKIVLNAGSGSITFLPNFATTDHSITFPPSNAIGVLRNNGFGGLSWMNDLFTNSHAIGDISAGSSNIPVAESKLHVKGTTNTTGGLLIESSTDSVNRLAIFSDTSSGSAAIQKLAGGSLIFYDSLSSKDFELNASGDGIFYNDVDMQGTTRITDNTQSNNCTTGALIVTGGVGISKNLNVCGTLNVEGGLAGVTTILNTTQSTDCTSGALLVSGGVGIVKNLNVCGDTGVQNIDIGGRIKHRVRVTSSNTDLDDDYLLMCTNTGTINVDLPDVSDPLYVGVTYMVIKRTGNTVRVRGNGPDDIFYLGADLGQVNMTGAAGELLVVISDGVKWYSIPT
jgi:hypothetical protein